MFYLIYLMPVAYPMWMTTAPPLKDFDATGYKVSANYEPWMYREPYRYLDCFPPKPVPIAAESDKMALEYSIGNYMPPPGRFEHWAPERDDRTGEYGWVRGDDISENVWFDADGVLIASAETEKDVFTAIRGFLSVNHIKLPYTNVSVIDYTHGGTTEKIKSVEVYSENISGYMDELQRQFPSCQTQRFAVQFYIHEGNEPPHYEHPPKSTEPDRFVKAWFDYHDRLRERAECQTETNSSASTSKEDT